MLLLLQERDPRHSQHPVSTICHIYRFAIYSAGSALALYNEWLYQLYNTIFTAVPIVCFALFDKEQERTELLENPGLYALGRKGCYFNIVVFWRWMCYGILQGGCIFFTVFYSLGNVAAGSDGVLEDFYFLGNLVFTLVVLVVNLQLLASFNTHTILSTGCVVITLAAYYITYIVLSLLPSQNIYGSTSRLFLVPANLLVQVVIVTVVLSVDVVTCRVRMIMYDYVETLKIKPAAPKIEGCKPTISMPVLRENGRHRVCVQPGAWTHAAADVNDLPLGEEQDLKVFADDPSTEEKRCAINNNLIRLPNSLTSVAAFSAI